MFRFIVLASVLVLAVQGQYNRESRTAAIISEQRYLSGNGKFGAAYTQEDGINFKEEVDEQGTRRGKYSYVDPDGKTRTITYTAGVNGFQASGDDLPVAPPAPAHAQLAIDAARNQPRNFDPNNADFSEGQYDPRWNDPSFNGDGRSAPIQQSLPAPQYNQQPQQFIQQPQPQQPQYQPQPQQQQYQPQPQYNNNYNNVNYEAQYQSTTPNPARFSPPGKLSLSRTPDGFSYSFNKV